MTTSKALDVTEPVASSDDAVHFNQAAKALGVSRKTIERMVKKNDLERIASPDGAIVAMVTKRSLVAELERRRGTSVDPAQLARDVARPSAPSSLGRDLRELVEPPPSATPTSCPSSTRERRRAFASSPCGWWRARR